MGNARLVILVFLLGCGIAAAHAQKNEDLIDDVQPPNFGPLGDDSCDVDRVISDLRVTLQISHTWVGDMSFVLTHDSTRTSASIFDRPGFPDSGFGCSGNDVDAVLFDSAGGGSVEQQCGASVPSISGDFTPFPDALAAFAGEELSGTWTLAATDHAGGDTGTLNTWCLGEGSGGVCCSSPGLPFVGNATVTDTLDLGGGGGSTGDVPATGAWGMIALIGLLMVGSLFFMRRRAGG